MSQRRRDEIEALRDDELRTHDQMDQAVEDLLAEVDRLRGKVAKAKPADQWITKATIVEAADGQFRIRFRRFGQWNRSGKFATKADAEAWLATRRGPGTAVAE